MKECEIRVRDEANDLFKLLLQNFLMVNLISIHVRQQICATRKGTNINHRTA